MPKGSMRALPHYRQSNEGACLPACARMVLAAMGHFFSESELAKVLGSYSFGTPASRIIWLEQLGVQVSYRLGTLDDVRHSLTMGNFPIVFVAAEFLP